jgi:hypothetical protein
VLGAAAEVADSPAPSFFRSADVGTFEGQW